MFRALQFLLTQQPIFWLSLAGTSFCAGLSVARWMRVGEAERNRLRSGPSLLRIRSKRSKSARLEMLPSTSTSTSTSTWYGADRNSPLPPPHNTAGVVEGSVLNSSKPPEYTPVVSPDDTVDSEKPEATPHDINNLFSRSYPSGPS